MKTLAFKNNRDSIFLFDDSVKLEIIYDKTVARFSDGMILNIGQCTLENAVVYENVTPPDDWMPHKFFYDGAAWTQNPNFVEYLIPPEPAN